MSTKNRAKHLIHTLSIDHKASNKQIAKDFGKFVRELVYQQRGGKFGENYKSMEKLELCLFDEMANIFRELGRINNYFDQSTNVPYNRYCKALTHFWNNTRCSDNFTEHFLDGDKAVVITNDKTLQENLSKVSSFND